MATARHLHTPRRRRGAWALLALLAILGGALALACDDDDGPRTLTILTHDSFDALDEVITAFEEEHNATVRIIQGGDANAIVSRAILNAGNPEADLLFGVDNLSYQRALDADVFAPYEAGRRDEIPADIRAALGDSEAVTPIDYGFVDLNFDSSQGAPPATFEDLLTEEWKGKLVVQDPATSSPGLQFLASTVAYFGEDGWEDFWRGLRDNDVLVVDGWSSAYYEHFTLYEGGRPLVVSYTTSPAAEVFFGDLEAPPTVNVVPGPLFRQVEAAGVLRGADHPDLAEDFIDFMLSEAFQQQIPETMFVYPVMSGIETPPWWQWASIDVDVAELSASADDIERWIREWTAIMRR